LFIHDGFRPRINSSYSLCIYLFLWSFLLIYSRLHPFSSSIMDPYLLLFLLFQTFLLRAIPYFFITFIIMASFIRSCQPLANSVPQKLVSSKSLMVVSRVFRFFRVGGPRSLDWWSSLARLPHLVLLIDTYVDFPGCPDFCWKREGRHCRESMLCGLYLQFNLLLWSIFVGVSDKCSLENG
jgi:hypothetical protein